ncbi:hypothetical protein GCM10010361_52470 [Streptomyces olivaceiscleroticus]|uniref:Uncharacterized protein n=1 Tax=Streptomyces olivaceiscleroticus TaxID=68245 RepID=A0ABN1APH7_9ACTN
MASPIAHGLKSSRSSDDKSEGWAEPDRVPAGMTGAIDRLMANIITLPGTGGQTPSSCQSS